MSARSIRVVVAEDEELAREKLARWIAREHDCELVAEAADGPAALQALRTHRPDLLFLDVRMPGLSGLDVLARAPRPPFIIFTTAFDDYAVPAFDLEAVDYLLKPFGPARFRSALDRVRRRRAEVRATPLPAQLHVVERGRMRTVPVADVTRFEARDDYVAAWTPTGRHLLSIRMASLAARLDATQFLRVHRSHIVNVAFVREYAALGGGRWRVTMTDGSVVDSSRSGGRLLRAHRRTSA